MAEEQPLQQATTAVRTLLDSLKIERVVCVDDLFSVKVPLEDVQSAQLELEPSKVAELTGEASLGRHEDRDIRRQAFEQFWRKLNTDQQTAVGGEIIASAHPSASVRPPDAEALVRLKEIVGEPRLLCLSPTNWTARQDELLTEAKSRRTLLLFDQDLSNDNGSKTGGIAIIKSLLATTDSESLMCGLLTHTVALADEHSSWVALANQYQVDQDRFVVVAKDGLTTDPVHFARSLKRVALSPDCYKMKELCRGMIERANAKAQTAIDDIRIDDFDSMVFRVAKTEGLWEPDMLFRLYGIFHRAGLRDIAYSDIVLRELSARMRSVSEVPTPPAIDTPPPASTWKIQKQEMYDVGEYVNKLHLPLEVGDIFQKTDGTADKYYILLGQPCDLMVRSGGKRSPDSNDFGLAEISSPVEPPKEHQRIVFYHLKCFGESRDKKYFVRLRPLTFINPCVIDLCALNADGVARINCAAECPENLIPTWRDRYGRLKDYAEAIIKKYDSFGRDEKYDAKTADALRRDLIKQFPIVTSNASLFKATLDTANGKRQLSFNCKRVGRLHRDHALAVTLEYTHLLSRPAFEVELDREDRPGQKAKS